MKRRALAGVLLALLVPTAAFAGSKFFRVKAKEFDPGRTFLVQAEWLSGIGCPTNARTATPNASFTDWTGQYGSFTDPACPTGDRRDKRNTGLLLAKTGPTTTNFASATAKVEGVKGKTISELGWDIRKPGAETHAGLRGSHCGAGAPRWNITTKNGGGRERSFFLGCSSPAPTSQQAGQGFVRMRWGAGAAPLMAFEVPGFALVDITGMKLKRLRIVFDEGYDSGPSNFGLAVLDNIDVNGVLVGQGRGGGDDDDDDDDDDD
jgi:hypothetical protein